ncbi:MAG: hypothetical protein IJ190_07310 [Prevotella sp.]|nr:hypothetical protein [Prevotella sp.]
MRKALLSFAIAMVTTALVACGNKTKTAGADTDSLSNETTADSLAAQADDVEDVAPADLWTVEAVEYQVRQMYKWFNGQVKANAKELGTKMDDKYCTGYYLLLKQNIAAHDADATGDMRFFGDETGCRWTANLSTPLTIERVKAELLTGNMARAEVKFVRKSDEQGEKGVMTFELWMENGRWCVNNFIEPDIFSDNGYIGMMEEYARNNNIPMEEEEPTEGAPL